MTSCKKVVSVISVLLIGIGIGCGSGPTGNNGGPSLTDYYPLGIGNWWTMEVVSWAGGDTTGPNTVEAEIVDDMTVFDYKPCYLRVEQPGADTSYLVLTGEQLRIYSEPPAGASSYDVPLKLPVDVGSIWVYSYPPAQDTIFAEITSNTDSLQVPAGSFENCLRVEISNQGGIWFTTWFTRGVGPVRSYNSNDEGWDSQLRDYHIEKLPPEG